MERLIKIWPAFPSKGGFEQAGFWQPGGTWLHFATLIEIKCVQIILMIHLEILKESGANILQEKSLLEYSKNVKNWKIWIWIVAL